VCERTIERLQAFVDALSVEDRTDDKVAVHNEKPTIKVSPPTEPAAQVAPPTHRTPRRIDMPGSVHWDLDNLGHR
jgi:hypothetical protein